MDLRNDMGNMNGPYEQNSGMSDFKCAEVPCATRCCGQSRAQPPGRGTGARFLAKQNEQFGRGPEDPHPFFGGSMGTLEIARRKTYDSAKTTAFGTREPQYLVVGGSQNIHSCPLRGTLV